MSDENSLGQGLDIASVNKQVLSGDESIDKEFGPDQLIMRPDSMTID